MLNGRRQPEGPGAGRPRTWQNVGLAALVATLVPFHTVLAPPGRTDLDVLAYALLVIGPLALLARHRLPVVVLLITATTMFSYQILGYPGVVSPGFPVLVAIYTATKAGHRVAVCLVTGIALVKGTAATIMLSSSDEPIREVLQSWLLLAGWLIAAGVIGEVSRKQQDYLDQVEQRAAEAERGREEMALRRAGEERLRIARELHDSLTHIISVIKVQAGVAVHLARKRGEPVPEALQAIQDASTDAVRELRATLEVLRSDDGAPGDSGSTLPGTTGKGLGHLPELETRAALSGVATTLTVRGDPSVVPEEIDRAAYRIVQEALTNVTRHAGQPAHASICLTYDPDGLTVQVDDNGRAQPEAPPIPGVGLRGMHERVAALGGLLVARPRPEGGFTVRAELPLGSGTGRLDGSSADQSASPVARSTTGRASTPTDTRARVPATEGS